MDEIWIGAVATGIVSVTLHWLKEGGVRRARRRNITEELALLKVLTEHPEPAARIRARVTVMLDQYEPSQERVASRRQRLTLLLQFFGMSLVALLAVVVFEVSSPWAIGAIGGALGLGANVVAWIFERRRDRAEQDDAVNEVVTTDTARAEDESMPAAVDPRGTEPANG